MASCAVALGVTQARLHLERIAGDFVRTATFTLQLTLTALVFAARYYISQRRRRGSQAEHDPQVRNVFIYASEILFTTAALGIVLPTFHAIFAEPRELDGNSNRVCISVALGLLGGLYSFETVWKPRLGVPLAFHHVSTVLIGVYYSVFLAEIFEDGLIEAGAALMASVFLMSLTEQPIYIGLLLRRFEYHQYAAWNFLFSVVHTLGVKIGIGLYTLVRFIQIANDHYPRCQHVSTRAFLIVVPPIFAFLMVAQLYIAKIYIALYRSSVYKAKLQREGKLPSRKLTPGSSERTGKVTAGPSVQSTERLARDGADPTGRALDATESSNANQRSPPARAVLLDAANLKGENETSDAAPPRPAESHHAASGTGTDGARAASSGVDNANTAHPAAGAIPSPSAQQHALRREHRRSIRDIMGTPAMQSIRNFMFTPVPGLDTPSRSSDGSPHTRPPASAQTHASSTGAPSTRFRRSSFLVSGAGVDDGVPVTIDEEDVALGLESGTPALPGSHTSDSESDAQADEAAKEPAERIADGVAPASASPTSPGDMA